MKKFFALNVLAVLWLSLPTYANLEAVASNPFDSSTSGQYSIAGTYFYEYIGDVSYQWLGQSFTVESTGLLDSVLLWGYKQGTPNVDIQLDIYLGHNNNNPIGNSLATAFYSEATINGSEVMFPFNTNIILEADQKYVWVISLPDDTSNNDYTYVKNGFVIYHSGNTYAGGQIYSKHPTVSFSSSGSDRFFTVYADTSVPEPATLVILTIGGLFLKRRKRIAIKNL